MSNSAAGTRTSQPIESASLGLTVLVSPDNPSLDVIFVHGFTGHPQRTWQHNGVIPKDDRREAGHEGSERPSKFQRLFPSSSSKKNISRKPVYWPRDLVPETLPRARVLTFGYDTNIRHPFKSQSSKSTVYDIAKDLLVSLEAERRSEASRPLMFIAHSLGGIVVKEALRKSRSFQTHQRHLHQIYEATKAVVFFGTPHSGADPRSLVHHVVEKLARAVGFSVNEQIVNTLLPSSERLKELRDEFSPMAHEKGWIIYSFQEQYGVLALNSNKVVDDTSSTLSDPIIEMTQQIASNHMEMCRFGRLDDVEFKKVAAALIRISDAVTTKPSHRPPSIEQVEVNPPAPMTSEQRQKYLDALAFPQIDARLLNIKMAHDETCAWLLERDEYKEWLDPLKIQDHHGFLWVKGKRGPGKSTMVKYALAQAKREMSGSIILSFFFNARGEAIEKSSPGMYRSLLVQLLTALPTLPDELVKSFKIKKAAGILDEWTIDELTHIFLAAFEQIACLDGQDLMCFIDALDECAEDQVRDMVDFLERLGCRALSSGIVFHVYLSSRHYPHISIDKGISLVMEDQTGHGQDIAKYVESKLKAGRGKKVEEVKAEILEKASGVFLWVVLVIKMLNEAFDHGQIYALRKRLKEMPSDLDALFTDILTRDNKNKDELLLCLQWILYASRPLKSGELYFAVVSGIDPTDLSEWDPEEVPIRDMEKFILSCSKGLAETTKAEDHTVQFIHESVRDFLLGGNGLAKLQLALKDNPAGLSHERLKQCCRNYLAVDLSQYFLFMNRPSLYVSGSESVIQGTLASITFPFLEYAVHNLLHHSEVADDLQVSQDAFLEDFELATMQDDGRYRACRHPPETTLLYVLAEKNLAALVRIRLRRDSNINVVVNFTRYGTPIFAALFNRNEKAIRALLLPGPSSRIQDDMPRKILLFPDWVQEHAGYEAGIRQLFKKRIEIMNYDPKRRSSLLSAAAELGYKAAVELLLATCKVDVNLAGPNGRTALSLAAEKRQDTIAKMLLVATAPKVDRVFDDLGTKLLSWAASYGHEAVVKFALETRFVNVNGNSKFYNDIAKPLELAARGGFDAIVKLLLADPRVDVSDTWPLYSAASGGHYKVVELLLGSKKAAMYRRESYSDPLLNAAKGGHDKVVQAFLRTDKFDLDFKDLYGKTALKLAKEGGHDAVVKVLEEYKRHPSLEAISSPVS